MAEPACPPSLSQSLSLRRPRLLLQAARCGVASYRRERDLPRITGQALRHLAPRAALARLLAQEAALEEVRRSGAAGYRLHAHVEVLIALLAEARVAAAG